MARLNEASAPPVAEPIDALKRRFVRQNRELAKNNSAQSIRIRTLETETSRLLSENLALREENIQLRNELEDYRNRHHPDTITSVKDRLEAKMRELETLIAELDVLKRPRGAAQGQPTAVKKSPEERDWRNPLLVPGAGEYDGLLPTIREDKYFPRRTLDAEEICSLFQDQDSQSPDLGPPPVAHFQDVEPVKFNPNPDIRRSLDTDLENSDNLPAVLSVNLETRRKRRHSSDRSDIRRMMVFESPPEVDNSSLNVDPEKAASLRTGAKRKLSACVGDERSELSSNTQAVEFVFSRRTPPNDGDTDTVQISQGAAPVGDRETTQDGDGRPSREATIVRERRALGEKSVNTDPIVSPKKKANPKSTAGEKLEKPQRHEKASARIREQAREVSRARTRERKARTTTITVVPEPPIDIESAEIKLEQFSEPLALPPKTPAGLDLTTPASSEHSTRPPPKDTPPPVDLDPTVSGDEVTRPNGRAARRARSTVNYAEPNLVSKMRRPTKELVDAVLKEGRPTIVVPQSDSRYSAPPTEKRLRAVVIKREREDARDDAWKDLQALSGQGRELGEPNSPLGKKTAVPTTISSSKYDEDLERATTVLSKLANSQSCSIDGPGANACSSSRTSKRRSILKTSAHPAEGLEPEVASQGDPPKREKRLSFAIYDFADSSPAEASSAAKVKSSREDSSQVKVSRRHSSTSSLSTKCGEEGTTNRGRVLRELRHSRSTSNPVPGASDDDNKLGNTREKSSGRCERAAARRRSMML